MTPHQIDLARHALGLTKQRMSYRNYFTAGRSHGDYADWMAMVEAGYAMRRDGANLSFGGDDLFHMTEAGAKRALRPGETLDREDFPSQVGE